MESKFSLKLGKPFGIELSIHWTFSLLIAYVVYISVGRGLDLSQILMYILFILSLFVCVVLHEFGHSLTAMRLGGKVQSITLLPIGGMANISEMPDKPKDEFLITAAGPLVNVVIAVLIWLYLSIGSADIETMEFDVITANNFLVLLLAANLFIVVFNLIPAFPMDGGRLFRSALSMKMSKIKATRIAKDIGQIFAVIFIFAGFFYNPFLIIIGIFVLIGAKGEYEMMKFQDAMKNYTVEDIKITDYEEFEENDLLGDAAEKLIHASHRGFVITANGEYSGILTKNDLIRGLNIYGKEGKIKEVVSKDIDPASPDKPLFEVFLEMHKKKHEMIPVIKDGILTGILDMECINEFFLIRNALK